METYQTVNIHKKIISSASQTGQKVVDAIKSGELLVEEVDELLAKVRK